MAVRVVWTQRFRNELRREYEFLRPRNPAAATTVLDRIIHAARRLRDFPRSGRSWRLEGTWELVVPGLPYIVVYTIEGDIVLVLMLFHTSRDVPDNLH